MSLVSSRKVFATTMCGSNFLEEDPGPCYMGDSMVSTSCGPDMLDEGLEVEMKGEGFQNIYWDDDPGKQYRASVKNKDFFEDSYDIVGLNFLADGLVGPQDNDNFCMEHWLRSQTEGKDSLFSNF